MKETHGDCLRITLGILIIVVAISGLFAEDWGCFSPHHLKTTLYIILGLGLLCIFYKNLSEIDFGWLRLKLREAKAQLNEELERSILRLFINSIILDSNDKDEAKNFFDKPEIGKNLKIYQSTNYCLNELAQKGCIEFKHIPGKPTNNAQNGLREKYNVEIIKEIPIR